MLRTLASPGTAVRAPRCQSYLSCQGFCVTCIVVPLRTLQLAREETNRLRVLFIRLPLQQHRSDSMLAGIDMYCRAQGRVKMPQQLRRGQHVFKLSKSMITLKCPLQSLAATLAPLEQLGERR